MSSDRRPRRLRALSSQIERLNRRVGALNQKASRLSQWRLASFALIFLVGSAVFFTRGALPWAVVSFFLLIPFILFVRRHRQVEWSIKQHQLLLQLKIEQRARMMLDWQQIPLGESCQVQENHPFALDLNLVGRRSLLHLIDVSVTREGSQKLCDWLLETEPNPDLSVRRRPVVEALMQLTSLRDRLTLNSVLAGNLGEGETRNKTTIDQNEQKTKMQWSAAGLLDWLKQPDDLLSLRRALIILLILVPINIGLLAGTLLFNWPPIWIASWLLYGLVTIMNMQKIGPIFHHTAYLKDRLQQLSSVFALLESRSFSSYPALEELLQPIRRKEGRPSMYLARVNRLLSAAGLGINPIIAFLLNAIVPWDIFLSFGLGKLKQELAVFVSDWLNLWYELEAYWGLANFGTIYPEATFAEFLTDLDLKRKSRMEEKRPIEAKQMGHPLINTNDRITNDFLMGSLGEVLIISGSNMSGKSTFLRTIGINICLAQAGGPVLADSFKLLPFRIAASIRIVDSLADGFSFFYAEVRRLKIILDELQKPHAHPLFFLIDEIFRGTNNRERLIGSRSFVKALVGGYGTGAIATHDLVLVQLAETNQAIHNAHFRDDVVDGKMVFDYRLYPGPCPTTNALRIMKSAGLPVDADEGTVIETAK